MTTELELQLRRLKHGDHLCLIYENAAEQLAASVPFIRDGLACGERCVYIAEDRTVEAIAQALSVAGLDVTHERERGALWMLTKQDNYLQNGKIDPQAMIDFLRSTQTQALADGLSGLRVAGEMSWVVGLEIDCDRVIEYEALLSKFLANSRSILLCQYNRSRLDPSVIHDVLRTHPIAILGDLLCPNPYCEPLELVLSSEPPASAEFKAKRVGWWIAQLKRARAAEQERERVLEKLTQSERRLAEAQQVAEDALRESERKLAQSQRVGHFGYWEYDFDADRVAWSDEGCRILGIPLQSVWTLAEFRQLIYPEDQPIHAETFARVMHGQGTYDTEYRVVRLDGEVRWIRAIDEVIWDELGHPRRAFGVLQDITERKNAQDELKRQKEQTAVQLAELENIYACAPVGLGSVDRKLRFVRINEQLAAMNGVSVAGHIGRTVREVNPQIADVVEGLWNRVFTSGQPVLNVEIHGETATEPGVDRYWLVNYVPLRSQTGAVVGGTGAVVDITDHKRALERLKESERRLAEAQQVAHIGSWERDLRTNELIWSAETFRLFGEEPSPKTMTFESFLVHVYTEDVQQLQNCVDRAVRERQPFSCEYRLATSDATFRWLHDRGAVVVDEAGEPIRVVGTVQDVTERKRIDAERETLYQQVLASREELRVLSRRLIQTQEEERRRLAGEVHVHSGPAFRDEQAPMSARFGLRRLLAP